MVAAPGTTVVTGNGLGPDLQVPVPFVMARRTAAATRFAALYEPCRGASKIRSFVQKSPDRFEVNLGEAVDEITVTRGKLRVVRTLSGGKTEQVLTGDGTQGKRQ
jgi:hypothetical protein